MAKGSGVVGEASTVAGQVGDVAGQVRGVAAKVSGVATGRSGLGSPPAPPDRISLLGLRFFGHHGVNQWERDNGQPFEVDLEVEMDLAAPGRTDRVEDGLDYTVLHAAAREVVEGASRRLMESLAENIAARVLAHPPVRAVTVRVRKPRAGLPGIGGTVQVEIHRRRGG